MIWKTCVVFSLLSLILTAASRSAAQVVVQQRDYDCKVIARTNEFFLGLDAPGLNAYGDVTFLTLVPSGAYLEQQVRLGRGVELPDGSPETHVLLRAGGDPANALFYDQILSAVSLDDTGRSVIVATLPPSGLEMGIYAVNPGGGTHLLHGDDDTDPQSQFVGFNDPLASSTGGVFFTASGYSMPTGVYLNSTFVAPLYGNQPGEFSIQPPALVSPNSLDVAWIDQEYNSTQMRVLLDQAVLDQSVFSQGDWQGGFLAPSVSQNGVPFVSYVRHGFPGSPQWQIVLNSILVLETFVDATADPFDPFSFPTQTAVNAWGEVVFVASPNLYARSLLVADGGPTVYRVRCPEHDAGLTSYNISPRAINADGQIAFSAFYFDPVTFETEIYYLRADPLPGQGARPTSCAGLADDTPCDDGDPETISSCVAQQCVGDPLGRPVDCAGLPDDTACDDLDPSTYSFCMDEVCETILVPEPSQVLLLAAGCAMLVVLQAAQRRWSCSFARSTS